MTRRVRMTMLGLVATVCTVCLTVTLLQRELLRDPKRPSGPDASAAWLADHPADWIAASEVTGGALDSNRKERFALWHRAYGHAEYLAPLRPNGDAAFVRAGLFHWYELGSADRAEVKRVASPLLADPGFFVPLHVSLWQLTRDFAWLHANAPDTLDASIALRELAAARGLFDEYRRLREEVRDRRMQKFSAMRAQGDPLPLVDLVPDRLTAGDEPLVRGILEELDRQPFDPSRVGGRIEALVDYAVRHDVKPLTGIVPLLATPEKLQDVTRARTALDLGDAALATQIEMTSAIPGTAEWEPYYIDRALFEARRNNGASADAYLVRATKETMTPKLLAAAEQVATILGDTVALSRYRRALGALPREPWSGGCGVNELCSVAWRNEYVSGETLQITLTTTQSDETAPYVELYVDDALRAEGPVGDTRAFTVPATRGLHRVELRVANPQTRNGVQRRLAIR